MDCKICNKLITIGNKTRKTCSNECKLKLLSISHKGQIPVNLEQLRLLALGRVHSKETKEKIRQAALKNGTSPSFKGYHHTAETKLKLSKTLTGRVFKFKSRPSITGENHYRWIKDRNLIKHQEDRNNPEYKQWRLSVWKRDGFKCKIGNEDCCGRLEAHHILGFTDHPELRYDINNGITLCHAHHPRKRSEEAKLSPYFQKLVAEKK